MDISIRNMQRSDLEKVLELDRLSFTLPWPERAFAYELEHNPNSRCRVAELTGENDPILVGMIVAWLIVDEIHIATLAVHPEYRRRKIGHKLLAITLIDGVKSGATCSFLEVRHSNVAARALYESFGYEKSGIRKAYYKDNFEDAILMDLNRIDLSLLESLQ